MEDTAAAGRVEEDIVAPEEEAGIAVVEQEKENIADIADIVAESRAVLLVMCLLVVDTCRTAVRNIFVAAAAVTAVPSDSWHSPWL